MASAKKKLDEEHLKLLREMVALAHNKHCFDCHQRGPTYVNMTIGSFVCTACSGLLRGLNPPHRVKSISMASFSVEEMDFVKSRGNDFCRKVWLGTFDSRMAPEIDSKDENRMREMMMLRYDKKRWYVQPTEAMFEEARRQNKSGAGKAGGGGAGGSGSSAAGSKPPLTLLVGNSASASAQQDKSPTSAGQSIQRPSHNTVTPPLTSTVSLPSPRSPHHPAGSAIPPPSAQLSLQKPASVNLLGDDNDFFGSSQPQQQQQQQQQPAVDAGFADFSAFSSPQTVMSAPGIQQQSVLQPSTSNKSPVLPISIPTSSTAPADKYSALADLESVFSSTSISGATFGGMPPGAAVNWGGGGPPTSTMWGAPAAGVVGPGMGAVGPVGVGSGFGHGSPLGMSPPSYSSIAAMSAFSGQPPVAVPGASMPFHAAPPAAFQQAYPAAANYGYFGQMPPAAQPGFGMFASAAPTSFAAQNGAAGGSAGFGAAPAGGFFAAPANVNAAASTNQRASWAAPTANPFMGQPASSGPSLATNPFL